MLNQAAEDYLKGIYKLQCRGERVTNSGIAEELGVTPASVTSMVKRLAQLKLLRHMPHRGVELTAAGEKVALEVMRHHRLLELYLAESLGVPWDRVHEEADRLEHYISEDLEERIDAILGHPTRDPHGDPIPTKEGVLLEPAYLPLSEAEPGATVALRRVSDSNPEMLRYLARVGLVLNAAVEVLSVESFGGTLTVQVGGAVRAIGLDLARSILVSRLDHPSEQKEV